MSRSSVSPAHALRSPTAGRAAVAAVVRRLASLVTALRHRAEVRHLAELDDRALKDNGLSRSEVDGALAVPFYVNPSTVLVRAVERPVEPQPGRSARGLRPVVPTVRARFA
jgi:uncharacterized protein YjiS (DUF1127 family)